MIEMESTGTASGTRESFNDDCNDVDYGHDAAI
jgi:hypothetical protein